MEAKHVFWKAALAIATMATPVEAIGADAEGRVISIDGHIHPYCRALYLKRDDNGAINAFRIPDTGTDNSIEAVAITAAVTGKRVLVNYDSQTTGCGTEPRVIYIRLFSQKIEGKIGKYNSYRTQIYHS